MEFYLIFLRLSTRKRTEFRKVYLTVTKVILLMSQLTVMIQKKMKNLNLQSLLSLAEETNQKQNKVKLKMQKQLSKRMSIKWKTMLIQMKILEFQIIVTLNLQCKKGILNPAICLQIPRPAQVIEASSG